MGAAQRKRIPDGGALVMTLMRRLGSRQEPLVSSELRRNEGEVNSQYDGVGLARDKRGATVVDQHWRYQLSVFKYKSVVSDSVTQERKRLLDPRATLYVQDVQCTLKREGRKRRDQPDTFRRASSNDG